MNNDKLISYKEKYRCFSCTVAGINTVNQDAAKSYYDKDKGIAIAVVSDGHGAVNHFRSAEGAKIAVKIALQTIKEAIEQNKIKSLESIKYYSNLILIKWRKAVSEHFNTNSLTSEENDIVDKMDEFNVYSLYGTTLNAIAVTNNFWCAIKCGDGEVIRIDKKGRKYSLINLLSNDYEMINYTESLCSSKPKFKLMFEIINADSDFVAGLVVTDGVTNSFDRKSFEDFAIYIIKTQYKNKNNYNYNEEQDEDLINYLKYISNNGSCDDISIAGVFKNNM